MRIDLVRLHAIWMRVVFLRDNLGDHPAIENWKPQTTVGVVSYHLWSVAGVLLLTVLYPLTILGLATRFYSRRIDRMSASLGFIGVVLVSLVVWGALTLVTYVSHIAYEGFIAVATAGIVATVSAVLALYFTRMEERITTVGLGYPFGMNAIFLPPVVAALHSPALATIIFPWSEELAIWILDNVLTFGGVAAFIRASFVLDGLGHVGMWFCLAVLTGWILGILVTFTDAVRPSQASDPFEGAGE